MARDPRSDSQQETTGGGGTRFPGVTGARTSFAAPRAEFVKSLAFSRSAPAQAATFVIDPQHDEFRMRTDAPHRESDPLDHARRRLTTSAGVPETSEADTLLARLRSVLALPTARLLHTGAALEWAKPLLDFQVTGVRELLARDSLLLADDMGLGKTIQALAAIRLLVMQRQVDAVLVVVPASLVGQWREEARTWAPELRLSTVHGSQRDRSWQWRAPAHIYLTTYETLRSDFSENAHSPVAREWDLVVLDEAQKIKNRDTDISAVCKRLRRKRQWALTGTPLENSPEDIISILGFVLPNRRLRATQWSTDAELRNELRTVQLRRRKQDVLHDLPDKLVTQLLLPLSPRQQQTYNRVEREGILELRQRGEQLQVQNVLELILRLKQVCNFCPVSGQSSKLDDLRDRIGTLASEGHKALVFSQFTSAEFGARAIAAGLDMPALVYAGDQSTEERRQVLAQFRRDPRVALLVLSLRSGGYGLNLQEASYVFHFDRWWNPAIEAQAESRSHRMGQTRAVNVYTYTCTDTIEQRIDDILRAKRVLFDEIVDDVSIDVGRALTPAELFGLVGVKTPRRFSER